MTRVLLVEDDIDIAAGLGDYLERSGLRVDFAYNSAQAKARLQHNTFDVMVLDINLPDKNGLALCQEMHRTADTTTPVIFLTARGSVADKLAGFAAGAVDYMVKPFAPEELLARIRVIVNQNKSTEVFSLTVGEYQLDPISGLLQRAGDAVQLHSTALTIVRELMQSSPRCVSKTQLSEALWGDDIPESDPLRAHIYELRKQLKATFDAEPIHTIKGVGYRFGEEK